MLKAIENNTYKKQIPLGRKGFEIK